MQKEAEKVEGEKRNFKTGARFKRTAEARALRKKANGRSLSVDKAPEDTELLAPCHLNLYNHIQDFYLHLTSLWLGALALVSKSRNICPVNLLVQTRLQYQVTCENGAQTPAEVACYYLLPGITELP